ncbi:MAG TPA: PEGA domain-containing protein [bacterium]|nr:PEGA domain-containing protein [bacterium]
MLAQALSRRLLAAFLISQISGISFPLSSFAASATAPLPSASKKILVVPLLGPGSQAEAVEKVSATLRDELGRQAGLSVVDSSTTAGLLRNAPNLAAEGSGSGNLNRYLDQAKEFYRNFQFKEAVNLLENTIDGYRSSSGSLTEGFALVDAYLMLGNVEAGKNDLRKAHEAFREAARLDPDRVITERDYPPKSVAAFQKAREEFLRKSKPAALEVLSSPDKAEVILNGDAKGVTPAKLERFAEGEHFLLVKAPGYKPVAMKLQVPAQGLRQKIDLEKLGGTSSSQSGLAVGDLKDVNEQVRLGSALGKQAGVDKVVLVSLEEVGWNHKISARMIDTPYRASHKLQSVEVLDLPKDTRPASQVIAKQLAEASRLDLAKDPKKYADSDVIVIGKKKKRAWYKSPWLWGAVGVAVAGGTAGVLLMSGGGGSADDGSTSVSLSGPSGRTP